MHAINLLKTEDKEKNLEGSLEKKWQLIYKKNN